MRYCFIQDYYFRAVGGIAPSLHNFPPLKSSPHSLFYLQLWSLPEDLAAFPDADRNHPHRSPGPQPAVTWGGGGRGHTGAPTGLMWGRPSRQQGGASHSVVQKEQRSKKTFLLSEGIVEQECPTQQNVVGLWRAGSPVLSMVKLKFIFTESLVWREVTVHPHKHT